MLVAFSSNRCRIRGADENPFDSKRPFEKRVVANILHRVKVALADTKLPDVSPHHVGVADAVPKRDSALQLLV